AVVPSTGGAQLSARLVGSTQIVAGVDGSAARLLGGYVEVPDDPALAIGDAFTYSVWVRRMGQCPADLGRCGDERLIDKASWFVYELHEGGSRAAIAGKMFYCNANPAAGVWTHVALVYDVAAGLRCYTNGRLSRSWVPGQPDNFCSSCNGP